jgi:hypothetical protein
MIRLCANNCCIDIDITNKDWCKCWLIIDDNSTYLGSENLKYLKDHLLAGLDGNPQKISGHSNDDNFSWVLSLAEAHTALYIAKNGQDRVLLLQDTNGKDICRIELSNKKYLEWRNQITSIS